MEYPKAAILFARDMALQWLKDNPDGFPRSWREELRRSIRRGYEIYDNFEAPPIAGYEALEEEGLVERVEERVETVFGTEERIHFRLVSRETLPSDSKSAIPSTEPERGRSKAPECD